VCEELHISHLKQCTHGVSAIYLQNTKVMSCKIV